MSQGDTGTSGSTNACDFARASGDLVGNYLCLRGDGTSINGGTGTAIVPVGSPVTQVSRLCPNGPNCSATTAQRVSSGNNFVSGSVAAPSADFTVCAVVEQDNTTSNMESVAQFGVSGSESWYLVDTSANSLQFCTVDAANAATCVTQAAALVAGVQHVVCGTYHKVGTGTSRQTLYLDGVQKQQSTAGNLVNQVSVPIALGSLTTGGTTNPVVGRLFSAFKTDVELTAAQVTALSNLVLGPGGPQGLAGSYGEAITFTRASAFSCSDDLGDLSIIPSGRPCVSKGGVTVRAAVTNVVQQYNSIGTAPWATSNGTCSAPTVFNNTADVTAPDGSQTATKIVLSACSSASSSEKVQQSITVTAANWIGSLYLRTLSGSATVFLSATPDGATWTHASCSVTAAWSRCSFNGTMTAASWFFAIGVDTRDAFQSGGIAAQTIYAWGAQTEATAGSTPSDLCPTGSGPATCAAETAQLAASTPSWPGVGAVNSVSADATVFSSFATGPMVVDLFGISELQVEFAPSGAIQCNYSGPAQVVSAATCTLGVSCHPRCYYDGTNIGACIGAACTVAARTWSPSAGSYTASLGYYHGSGFQLGGSLSNVCIASSPWACP